MPRILLRGMWATLAGWAGLATAQDYPGVQWFPAHSSNFTVSNRPTTYPIDYVIIHTVQGSYLGALNWFANPNSNVSAHYTLRSADGFVGQSVREKDIGWHAGNWWYNCRSIGIEHEGYVSDPRWYTDAMLRASADLSRYLVRKYDIPPSRDRFIGHVEVPNATHTDPGPHWPWDRYMFWVRTAADLVSANAPARLQPREEATVSIWVRNGGLANWVASGIGAVRLGTQDPPDRPSDFAHGWLAPHRPVGLVAPIVPSQAVELRFPIRAPKVPGTYVESFQLVAEGLGWFGPVVTFTFEVGPAATVATSEDATFTTHGTWNTGTTAPGRYTQSYRWAHTGPSQTGFAEWRLAAPEDGYYEVEAWWSQGTNRTDHAVYIAYGSEAHDRRRSVVNQTRDGGRWNSIGRVYLRQGEGRVRLLAESRTSGRVVIADAVRIIGPYGRRPAALQADTFDPAFDFLDAVSEEQRIRLVAGLPIEYEELDSTARLLYAAALGNEIPYLRLALEQGSVSLESRYALGHRWHSGSISARGDWHEALPGKGTRYPSLTLTLRFGLDRERSVAYVREFDLNSPHPRLETLLDAREVAFQRETWPGRAVVDASCGLCPPQMGESLARRSASKP